MSQLITLNTVSETVQVYTGKHSDHPLIHVIDLAETGVDETMLGKRICTHLYCISVKPSPCAKVKYGHRHYDFSSGVLTAYAPGQVLQIEEAYDVGELHGWVILFHPDLLLSHPLMKDIKQLGYFSYDVCEALHLSDKEQGMLQKLVDSISFELQQNHDSFSLDIIQSSLELVLTYIDRYFHRQFLTRKPFTQDQVTQFVNLVDEHLAQAEQRELGLPTVTELAEQMNMSANYLSDLLKSQTGKSAQELIHQQLIEQAKYLLLNSDDSVSTIAYKLGFEYPQYFSRIFKKKTQYTPAQFRNIH